MNVHEVNTHWNNRVSELLFREEPNYSECAYFAKRRLHWGVWVPHFSHRENSLMDRNNLEFSHEHLVFSQSGHNVGFGPHGLFGEDVSAYRYRLGQRCYSGSIIRKALQSLGALGSYHFLKNNCQDFADKLRVAYYKLLRL